MASAYLYFMLFSVLSCMFKIFDKKNNLRLRDYVHKSSLLPGPSAQGDSAVYGRQRSAQGSESTSRGV